MNRDRLAGDLANHFEGTRLFPYTDTVGKLTIGVGHNLTDKGITPNQAAQLLYDDISDVVNFLNLRTPWWNTLDEVRQRALANMTFDLMGKILSFTGMLGCLQSKDWKGASDNLLSSLFAKQVGKRAVDLAHMFLTGQDI